MHGDHRGMIPEHRRMAVHKDKIRIVGALPQLCTRGEAIEYASLNVDRYLSSELFRKYVSNIAVMR
jgi:hypothetical protein